MNKILLFAITLLLPIGLNAQTNYLQEKVAEYYTGSIEQKIKMDSIYQPIADMCKKRQIKSIANIPFGTSLEKAEPILRNKFGTPKKIPGKNAIIFENIKYAGYDFDYVDFSFQSDGVNTYMNSCVFIIYATSLTDAIEKEKMLANVVLRKYNMEEYKDNNGNPMHVGGYSPLWNGDWKTFNTPEYMCAIHTYILKITGDLTIQINKPYAVRIMYGPYSYVKEEF
nr:hypothetical protein [uncultured Prevotella sp.]